jgi:hypothetical protein
MQPTPVTKVPARIAENPSSGWTVYSFETPEAAAVFVAGYPECEMPCWERFETIGGALMQVR